MTSRTPSLPLQRRRWLAAALAAALGPCAPALAQDYPKRPITLVVPYPAGGSTDVLGRALAEQLGRSLGQPVLVENKAGAATNLGAEAVARAPADGHTLLLASNVTLAVNPELYGDKLRFDPKRDFAPIARLARTQLALVVPASSKVQNARELVAAAKARPGGLSAGSFGIGSTSHLALELFKSMSGSFIVHVPYRGSAPAMQDLLGGQLDAMFDTVVVAAPLAKAGKLRLLAVAGAERSPLVPEVPTLAEATGLAGYEVPVWFALVAPAKTPKDVLARLQKATQDILATEAYKAMLAQRGFEPNAGNDAAVMDSMAREAAVYRRIIRYAKITPDA